MGNGTANGTLLELWDCNGVGGQKWVQQADGSLKNPQSGRCIDSPSGATANGTRLQIYDCNGSAAQKFSVNGGGPIAAPAASASTSQRRRGRQRCCRAAVGLPAACGRPALVPHHARALHTLGRCLDITGNGTANGALLELWDCNGAAVRTGSSRRTGR